jgi:hypothetical protein
MLEARCSKLQSCLSGRDFRRVKSYVKVSVIRGDELDDRDLRMSFHQRLLCMLSHLAGRRWRMARRSMKEAYRTGEVCQEGGQHIQGLERRDVLTDPRCNKMALKRFRAYRDSKWRLGIPVTRALGCVI